MNVAVAALWALVGWCGTPWPPRPWPPRGDQPVHSWITKGLGVVGGLVGGWAFQQLWAVEGIWSGIDAAASAVGAWVGAVFLTQLYSIGTWPQPEIPLPGKGESD